MAQYILLRTCKVFVSNRLRSLIPVLHIPSPQIGVVKYENRLQFTRYRCFSIALYFKFEKKITNLQICEKRKNELQYKISKFLSQKYNIFHSRSCSFIFHIFVAQNFKTLLRSLVIAVFLLHHILELEKVRNEFGKSAQ